MQMSDDMTPRHVLQGQALMDYLVERAADDAKSAIIDLDERRKRIVTLVFSIIAVVGVGSLVSIFKIYVRSELDVFDKKLQVATASLDKKLETKGKEMIANLQMQVDDTVAGKIDERIGAVKKILDDDDLMERYVELALELPEKLAGIHERGDKYVAEKMTEVVQAAEQLSKAAQATRRRRRFLMSTRQIVDVMTRFNRETEINRLDDLFGEVMASDQELSRTLVDHYGQLVVGSPVPVEAQADNLKRLQRYMQAAHDLSYPEKSLIWQLFVEFKRNQFVGNATTRSLLESTQDLSEVDRAEFWYNLYVYTDSANWLITPDQQGRELEQLMAALVQAYPQITQVMENNIAANDFLQARLANRRGKNATSRLPRPQASSTEAAPAESAEEAAPATAAAPGAANSLRQ